MGHHFATYLQDHRGGAVAAIGLLQHLEAQSNRDLAAFARSLRIQVEVDIRTLDSIMQQSGVPPSPMRKAAGWVGERVAALKVVLDDPVDGTLRTLETIEALALGIDGKHALWMALADAGDPALARIFDFKGLALRAVEQRESVETHRLAAARAAFEG